MGSDVTKKEGKKIPFKIYTFVSVIVLPQLERCIDSLLKRCLKLLMILQTRTSLLCKTIVKIMMGLCFGGVRELPLM